MVKLIIKPQPPKDETEWLAKELNIDFALAALLLQRGFSDAKRAKMFLHGSISDMSDPFLLQGMKEANKTIVQAITEKKKIVIFGDYDCDGIGAVAILYLTLKELNADVSYFIPERKTDGYGISFSAIERLFEHKQPDLIISVDCGISSHQEIALAKEKYKVEFIVTDHHELPLVLPNAIMINPHFGAETAFSGAGVALKLAETLIGRERAMKYIDICALSTIADVVPLTEENRIIVKEGLQRFNKRNIRPGLKELLHVSGIDGLSKVCSYDIAFKLAPRINASGRLDSAEKSIELLVENDVSALRLIAEALNEDNKLRQEKTESVLFEAKELLKSYDIANKNIIVLHKASWDSGVLGIAAARIAEAFRRPTILLCTKEDMLTGSARSVNGINLFETLSAAKKHLLKFGGHAAAAGMSLKIENLTPFIEDCRKYLEDKVAILQKLDEVYIDFEVSATCSIPFYRALETLQPYGMGNPKPIALFSGTPSWSRINTKPHLKARVSAETELVAFSYGDMLECWNSCKPRFAVSAEISVYQNRARTSLFIKQYEEGAAHLPDDVLEARYYRTFLAKPSKEEKTKREKCKHCGKLLIAFTKKTFLSAVEKHPNFKAFQAKSDTGCPENAIILSPDETTEFSYYNEIIFLDAPPKNFFDFINHSNNANVSILGEVPQFLTKKPTLDELRKIYLLAAKHLDGQFFGSTAEIYLQFFASEIDRLTFEIAFAVFQEMGLIAAEKNGMIHIIGKKTDLTKSAILRSFDHATT